MTEKPIDIPTGKHGGQACHPAMSGALFHLRKEMQMKKITSVSAALATAAVLAGLLVGCQKEGPGERAGKQVDKAVENAGKQIEKAGDKIQDAAQDAKK
jgi:hypothetical protein